MRTVTARHPLAYAIACVLAMAGMSAHAGTTQALSQGWLAQQASNRPATPAVGSSTSALSGITGQTPQQLLQEQQVQQSLANLARAAQAVAAQVAAQQSAQQTAQQQTSPVPNGLAPGGLVVAPGVAGNASLWQNASAPAQTTSNGQTTVQITQTAQKAILSWSSFNVGRTTTLYFNQSGGNQTNGSANNWIVLNRVTDPSGVPSQIFGQIKAEGTVYILNHNGILFGAGSQVNTQSLLASSLDLFSSDVNVSNSTFLTSGIQGGATQATPFLVDGVFTDGANHNVVVQQGASMTSGSQGFILLAAPNVSNAGSIVADDGEAILAAGVQFSDLSAGKQNAPLSVLDEQSSATTSYPGGTVTNTGLVQARRGQVSMLGYNVDQEGVALASTSISYPGSIDLNASDEGLGAGDFLRDGTLTLGPNSVTTVLPEKDGTTTTSTAAATAAFTPGSVSLTGGTVTFDAGSLVEAPNATLNVLANVIAAEAVNAGPTYGRIYVDNGAVIDVSGLADVELPMSALLVTIPRIGQNELADSPLLRNSFLYTQPNLVVDSTQSGVTADGLSWVGSPILNVSGYVQDIPRDITQMMTNGGSITFNGNQVIVRSGAQINLDGGYIAYQAGWITTPNLVAANGRIYNIADADPNQVYVGFAGDYEVADNRWGVTSNYSNPLLAGATRWDTGFAVGGNAGTLTIGAGTFALDGEVTAKAFPGRNQVANGTQPSGGTLSIPAGVLQQSVPTIEQIDPQFQASTPWQTVQNTEGGSAGTQLSADLVQQGGFSSLSVTNPSDIQETSGTVLSVLPGGSIQLTAPHIDVQGQLSAPSGSITLTSTGQPGSSQLANAIIVGDDAVLSARGLWVNDTGLPADNYVGDRYINGGSISLITDQTEPPNGGADQTGSILLQPGSLLDVSSGGYVNGSGVLQLTNGIPDGSGGNISLVTYAASGNYQFYGGTSGLTPPPKSIETASIQLGGTLRAYGFSGGGTLALQAADIQIGGNPANLALSNGLYLQPSFFAGQGFDTYALTSITDANIAPGTTLRISNDNLLPNEPALLAAPTGTDIYGISQVTDSSYIGIGQLAPYLRYVSQTSSGAGFSLSAGSYLDWLATPGVYSDGPIKYPGVTGSVTLGAGATIAADAGATVTLAGTQSTIVDGAIDAPGGTINVKTNALNSNITPVAISQVWLGSGANLNVAGVSLIDPLAAAAPGPAVGLGVSSRFTPYTGTVLNGGTVNMLSTGYLLTAQGSLINASGSADVYDLPSTAAGMSGTEAAYVPTPVWSNGGSIVFSAAAGLYADGNLLAAAGSASAEGGNLRIEGFANTFSVDPVATAIILQQSGSLIPAGLQPGGMVEPGGGSGVLHFALDRLHGSGITSLALGSDPTTTVFGYYPIPVGFAGNIDLSLGKSLSIYAQSLIALPAGSTALPSNASNTYIQGNGTVHITAPYVEIIGAQSPQPVAGDGTLLVNAGFIDLGDQINLEGWANATFSSSSDLRFYAPPNLEYSSSSTTPFTGTLFTTGNLSLQAAQIYPMSNYPFAVIANPSGLDDPQGKAWSTTLTILGNGASTAPLSAGGTLLLDADTIDQDGTVRAPSGTLIIGVSDTASTASALNTSSSYLVKTQNVQLGSGSITSVSLDGEVVPFGSTVDGEEWSYNGDPYATTPQLGAPPSKNITIAGANVSLDSGATIDISGGGDLQASEWVPGTGGTRDVLSQYETSYATSASGTQVPQYSDGRAIYAIIPGYAAPVAAQDAALENGAGTGPAAGQSVYLSGMPGLPAGYYVLLPAKYATLPGAYRVVQDTGSQDAVLGQNAVLPDGTLSVTGYFGNALDGAHNARTTTFLVQSSSVWQQYSQYQFSNANTYFANQASQAGTVAPALPMDAGHLILSATQQLQLSASLLGAPASGGRGSLVDIAAQYIQVTSPDSTPLAGYLQISADSLSSFDAGSLLLGGTRQLDSDGYQVTSVADSVVLSNDSAHPLQGPEILLVTDGNTGAQGIVLQSGSTLLASGSGSSDTTPLIFGSDASTSSSGSSAPAVSGDGALLRVSQNGMVDVTRNDVTSSAAAGDLTIDAGATVQGGHSLVMDTTGSTSVSPSAVFTAQDILANANQITFVGSDGATTNAGGLIIGPGTLNLLSGAQQVTLNSRGTIDFLGNVSIDLPQALNLNADAFASDGGQVSITAGTLGLGNSLGTGASTPVAGSGQLSLNAGELDFTSGHSALQGFGTVSATASQGMAGEGSGSLDFGAANVSLNTPVWLAQSGANTTLTTTGVFDVNSAAGTPLQNNAIGGALSLTGGSLTVATSVDASAGNLSLEATGGNLTIASGASLNTAGVNKTFYDTTTYAAGGNLKLVSDQGSVVVQQGATVDFAGAPLGGTAGGLTIQAAGQATLDGRFEGQAASGYQGGYFTLSSDGALDLDQLGQLTTNAGTTGGISISSGAGNLVLSAGQTLNAQDVYLAANGGTGTVNGANGVVEIDGTVNVSGAAAGEIELYGRNGVTLNGRLLAISSVPEQRGGIVEIGTTGTSDGSLNTQYGYENVQPGSAGVIQFGPNASINVSGGSPGAGGIVSLRAPLLANGDVPIIFSGTPAIIGASRVTIEPYAVWSTADNASDLTKHFDGLIDPDGWYQYAADGSVQMVPGTWTDASGNALPAPTDATTLQQYLSQDYFTPTTANAAHQTFYGYVNGDPSQGAGTLMSYVEQPGYTFGSRFAGISNAQIQPGIELINPEANVNGGDISVLTNWNLGAGTTDASGAIHLAYRYGATAASASGEAPILTIAALHSVIIDASITDGFYQQNDGATISAPAAVVSGGAGQLYANALAAYNNVFNYLENGAFYSGDQLWDLGSPDSIGYFTVNGYVYLDQIQDPYYQAIQAPLANQSAAYYQNYMGYINEIGVGTNWSLAFNYGDLASYLPYAPTQRVAPNPGSYVQYSSYVTAYYNWLTANFSNTNAYTETPSPLLQPLASEAASNYTNYSSDYQTYLSGFTNYYTYVSTEVGSVYSGGSQLFYAPYMPYATPLQAAGGTADNSPSNMPSLGNPVSLASATLLGGSSTTYRFVAGANFTAVDPLSVTNTDTGNVTLDGNFSVQYTAMGGNGKTLELPTTIRTGTGSIDIAASGDIDWLDQTAPATVYTAGAPAAGTAAGTQVAVSNAAVGSNAAGATGQEADALVTGLVNPNNAGDIVLSAKGNITGIEQMYDTSGSVTGVAGTYDGQLWSQWMQTGNAVNGSSSSINFANFDQGVMSVGGNVTVTAGGNISDLSVSLPTTWYVNPGGTSITTVGGGNLAVMAGGNILSGSYFVAKGEGSLVAGGQIGSDFTFNSALSPTDPVTTPVATILGAQDTQWQVSASGGVNLGGVYDPSYGYGYTLSPSGHMDGQSYSTSSALNVTAGSGDVSLGSLSAPAQLFGYVPGAILPASVNLAALNGNVNILSAGGLYPSATGELSVLAADSVTFAQLNDSLENQGGQFGKSFGLIDASQALLPSPLSPYGGLDSSEYAQLFITSYMDNGISPANSFVPSVVHQPSSLHANDNDPVRIYALSGNIVDGVNAPNGISIQQLILEPDKPALIYAGGDIVNLSLIGQQVHDSDITRIAAGGDIYDTQYAPLTVANFTPAGYDYQLTPSILLGGVGNLLISAGRNIGPLTNEQDLANYGGTSSGAQQTGIETVGNLINPYLPHDGANIDVLYGVAPGITTSTFLSQYALSNPNGVDGFGSLMPDLVTFMQQWQEGQAIDTGFQQNQTTVVLTPQQAQSAFQQLPSYAQELFAQQEFFKLLAQVDSDYNDPSSPYYHQYARGYAAIESLFPSSLGYTNNGSGAGGVNGEANTVDTGDLDIRSSTIQTQQGGNISILGPGGQALVGSVDAPQVITNGQGNVIAGPNSMGILTLEQGSIDIFTDRSVLLAQSRIFTEQGGDMVIWSSNGDINAGQGAKTTDVLPAPTYICTPDAYCIVDARGEVSGAGIATLQTIPGAARGSVYLVAPRGTVDAGDAGIRVSGNLVVAAAQVANADNIQVQGQKIGVPVAQSVNVGALTTAAAAAGAVSKVAQDMANQQQNDALGKQPSIISVQVLGFGDSSTSIQGNGSGYDPNSPVQILGAGPLSEARKRALTDAERRQLSE
ncbi:filamentous hemagglutinin N-terminal domain-containing protein [Dyella monticola]|uniref:Filamentous hemagglutinin N-terminal domain-containing protein n=1 Tax=Dyella monticola TaxID=1927958 RepID=A0A370X0J6_9GAMM|nr:filamentous haemagglutinin family protein [Dyella monticola]RDS81725.1 filamentous hemagglutinin N-terminal domain-containing protein [Dyella monticola]